MTSTRLRRARLGAAAAGLLTATLVPGLTQLPALASSPSTAATSIKVTSGSPDNDKIATLGDSVPGLDNMDARGHVLPTLLQKKAAAQLHAIDLRWNQFGSPDSILPASGVLASGYSKDPAKAPLAARSWLSDHAAVFGLTKAQVAALTLVNNQKFAQSPARAVLFRQNFGKLSPALDSMVVVGVSHGNIAYVSSSITRAKDLSALSQKQISPLQGWLAAAANVGRGVSKLNIAKITTVVSGGWSRFTVPGFSTPQLARVRSLAMADGTVVPVIEANVVDQGGASTLGYTDMVNAITGDVLNRENKVLNDNSNNSFMGSFTPTACGPMHAFSLKNSSTHTLIATGAAANSADDIVVKIFSNTGALLVTGDAGTSPEEAMATNAKGFPAGIYHMQVCPFIDPMVPDVPPFNYAATVSASESGTAAPAGASMQPRWRYFTSTPELRSINATTPHNSVVLCWALKVKGCTYPLGQLRNVQAPGPWDTAAATGAATLTTVGNNANTHEAWLSPLTPGGTAQAPVSATRQYTTPFTDAWNNSKCNPTQLVPGGNDIDASVTDLFVTHNLMHDYSYYLGFTESNYNMQLSNLGRGGVEGDQETGNAQAGAIDGGYPTFEGRDNANQIAMQDGVPGITNQYLFQPIAGAFYAPCTDGSLDFGIVGHEYTHEISNRMVGGPDENLTSDQGGAMGESWSDLNAAQYLYSHGYKNGGDIFAVGVYATQNKTVAIRDYAIDHNPLNYSDYGFDTPGPEVHADGEIWNGTQWSVRQALVTKYNKKFPTTNKHLELMCSNAASNGPNQSTLPAYKCPGDRRWIQLVYDAWLMQPGADSMLTARDTMLAADSMRFGGRDRAVMWKAFAARGMGKGAHIVNADDNQPTPSFASAMGKTAKVTFKAFGTYGKVYVGHYEARVTPVADTSPLTKALKNTTTFSPGTYQMLFVSQRRGAYRFTIHVKAGKNQVVKLKNPRDLASKFIGGKVIGSTAGSLNVDSLIDGTEATNWAGKTATNVDASHPFVSVDLAGGVSTIRRANVSAYLHPAPGSITDLPVLVGPAHVAGQAADPDSGSRFTALRQFALEACVKSCSSKNAKWKRFFTSKPNAFPATLPRPVAPNLTLRTFRFKPVKAAAVRFVVLENQCTGQSLYAGEQDSDPTNATDCKSGSDRGMIVHAAELQIFTK